MTDISTTAARAGTAAARYGSYPDLAGKVAIVTGGSRGIGAATAAALAANVALLWLVPDRRIERALTAHDGH